MAKREYLPLQVVQQMINTDPEIKRYFSLHDLSPFNHAEEYCSFIFGNDFLNKAYSGEFKDFNDFCRSSPSSLTPLLYAGLPGAIMQIEIYDYFAYPAVLNLWEKTKKVYKLEASFFEELCRTGDFEFPETSIKYLPFPTFYLDLSDCKTAAPIKGVFVHTLETDFGYQAVMYMISSDKSMFSFYGGLNYNKDRLASIKEISPKTDFSIHDPFTNRENIVNKPDRRDQIVKSVFQIMMFLSSTTPDIQENSETKQTYRPSSVVRNKFSEIQMWDVGVRYGRAIRFAKREAEKTNRGSTRSSEQRKPVRPHVRCAHWQRFRVGKGRTELRIRWIPPVFVCGSREIPVTIHEVSL